MGLFISFEGIDGSGKTLQIKLLKEFFKKKGLEVLVVREPGGTNIGEKIRDVVIDKKNSEMSYTAEALLYASSRAQLVEEVIIPALDKGKVVVSDRFVDSTIIYQGQLRGLGEKIVREINDFATKGLKPDITFLLDVTQEVSHKRRNNRADVDRLEREDKFFFSRLRREYLTLASKNRDRIVVINSALPPSVTHDNIKKVIENKKILIGR